MTNEANLKSMIINRAFEFGIYNITRKRFKQIRTLYNQCMTIPFTSLFGKNENQFGTNEIQCGTNKIQFDTNENQCGTNEIQFGRNEIQFDINKTYILFLTCYFHIWHNFKKFSF